MNENWRPTRVQQDIIDRLRDGWMMHWTGNGYCVCKEGEPSRHVREATAVSLIDRNKVRLLRSAVWTLAS